jgi:hypothetical protein
MNAIFTNIITVNATQRDIFGHTFTPRTPDTHLMFG